MDDERKRPPRKGGPKSGNPRDGAGRARTGKAGFGSKPFRGGDKKSFAKRRDDSSETRGERPKRDFRRDERPREPGEGALAERSGKPYRSGSRPDRKPLEKRGEGIRRPGRREREAGEGASTERSSRPYGTGPRPERRPFEGRGAGKKPSGEHKPFGRRTEPVEAGAGERIAKRLARAGIASRRDAEELIAAGRIRVNGRVLTSPAFNVLPDDTIELDGTTIPPIERTRLFLFHKPAGVVTTNRDPEDRKTVFDVLPQDLPRLMTIGRLDINTEGLLLLTNDGGLARVLELPATGWLRRYRVRVHGKVEEKALADLRNGIAVDGVFYGAVEASLDREQGTNAWLTIGLREGKNREVKNILGALGLEVTRLIRVSYGPFQLGELPEGAVQELKGKTLRDQLGERLIEEAGANFEAPITKPFSNKPVRGEADQREERPQRPRVVREGVQGAIGEGGLIKARKRRENSRDEALSRLSTRPERGPSGDRKAGPRTERGPKKFGERGERPIEPHGTRKANVWMAPGARPQGRKAETSTTSSPSKGEGQRFGIKKRPYPAGKASTDRRGDSPSSAFRAPSSPDRGEGKGGDRPRGGGPKGPRRGRNDADRRR